MTSGEESNDQTTTFKGPVVSVMDTLATHGLSWDECSGMVSNESEGGVMLPG